MERVLASDKRAGAVREIFESVADPLSKNTSYVAGYFGPHIMTQSCYQDGTEYIAQHDNGQVENTEERLQGMIAGNNGLF